MKILRLTISNIASIESACLDFTIPPLSTDSLFLIHGKTGSGKTTLLNCICLALYNNTPALDAVTTAYVDGDNLRTNNPQQLMRRGTGRAFVELQFEGNDGLLYTSRWESWRAHNKIHGAVQPVQRTLECVAADLKLTRQQEIKDKVEEVVGLTFRQFCRTTMLAQGQFTRFLKADDAEKADILEKLTGTDLYAAVGSAVHTTLGERRAEKHALEERLKGAETLQQEQIDERRDAIARWNAEKREMEEVCAAADVKLAWLLQREKCENAVARCTADLRKAEANDCAEDMEEARRTKAAYDACAPQRAILPVIAGARARLAKLEAEGREHAAAAGLLAAQGAHLAARLAEGETSLQLTLADLEAEADLEPLFAEAPRITLMSRQLSENRREESSARQESAAAAKGRAEKQKALTTEEAVAAKAEEALRNKQEACDAAESACNAIDRGAIRRDEKELRRRADKLADGCRALKEAADGCARIADIDLRTADARKALDEAATAAAAAESSLPRLQKELECARLKLDGQKELRDHIASLRAHFADEGRCPLCGAEGTHPHDDDIMAEALRSASARVDDLRKRLDETTSERAAAISRRKVMEESLTSLAKERDKTEKAVRKARAALGAVIGNNRQPGNEEEALASLQKQWEIDRRELEARAHSAEELEKQLSAARADLDSARKEAAKPASRIADLQKKIAALAEREEQASRRAGSAAAKAAALFTDIRECIPSHIPLGEETVEETAASINARAARHRAKQAEASAQTALCDTLRSAVEAVQGTLLPAAEEAGLPSTETTPAHTAEPATVAEKAASLATAIAGWHRMKKAADEELAEATKRLEDLLSQPDSPALETVKQLAAITPKKMKQLEQQIEAGRRALYEATGALRNAEAALAALLATRPAIGDEDTAASLQALIDNAKMAIDERTRLIAATERELANDADRRARLAEEMARAEELAVTVRDWETLDGLYGGDGGHRFRRIAQCRVLRALLDKANDYLVMLTDRYLLEGNDDSLMINIIDRHHGDTVREVNSLSGGETFIVSLALALGLSAISRSRIKVDTLFIDEGFGTLSADTLETVLDALDRLYQIGGRRVGVISHVEELKERISTRIRLEPISPSSSRVVVEG